MYDVELTEIVSEIRSNNCVLFIGSGLSIASQLPGWRNIINILSKNLNCTQSYDYLTIAQAYEQRLGRPSLIKIIKKHLSTTNKNPTKVHALLPSLGIRTWITTNFDNLLEITLNNSNNSFFLAWKDENLPFFSGEDFTLIKAHGDLNDPQTIIFTKNDYFTAPSTKRIIWDWLKVLLAQKTFLFVGYSLNDPDFSQLQAQILHILGKENLKKSYAIMFNVDDIIRADLESRNIIVLNLGEKTHNTATEILFQFLNLLDNRLKQFPEIAPEHHDKEKAESLVPMEKQNLLKKKGYRLIKSIEYNVFRDELDSGQFLPTPPGWDPPIPTECKLPNYMCLRYNRADEECKNLWKGWAIGFKAS